MTIGQTERDKDAHRWVKAITATFSQGPQTRPLEFWGDDDNEHEYEL